MGWVWSTRGQLAVQVWSSRERAVLEVSPEHNACLLRGPH